MSQSKAKPSVLKKIRTNEQLSKAKHSLFKHLVKCSCSVCDCDMYNTVLLRKKEVKVNAVGVFAIPVKVVEREADARRWAIVHTGD